MKFTKTAVAVAIAGLAAAPMMAAAETTLSGLIQINLQGSDAADIEAVVDDPATDEDETTEASSPGDLEFAGGDVNFQLNAQQTLNSGLTGYGNFRVDADSLSGGNLTSDSVHAGVKGGFGDIRVGEVNVIAEYGQVANDLHDQTGAINGGLHYEGSFGPASVGIVWSPERNEDVIGAGLKFGFGGFAIGLGAEERGGNMNASVGASFGFAGASIAAHYVTKENDGDADDGNVVAVQVGYGIAGVELKLTYSLAEDFFDLTDDDPDFETKIRLDAGYGLGGGTSISTRITANQDEVGNGDDLLEYRLQLEKSF